MKKRLISFLLVLTLLLPVFTTYGAAATESVEDIVYKYLTKELDLSPAAAAGIMGNIAIECNFDPTTKVTDTNGKVSYGLMMWNDSRYEALKSWCKANGYKVSDPKGQLGYLKWELTNTEIAAYVSLKNIPNTIEGACQATIIWAEKFERCTKTSYGLRICETLNTYWPDYAGGKLSTTTPGIFGYYYNVPINLKYGEPLTLYGAVVSYTSAIKSVTIGVYTEKGDLVTGKTIQSSTVAKNIQELDRYIVFDKVPKGSYYYTITAVNKDGSYVVEKFPFTVSKNETTTQRINESEGGIICSFGSYCPQLELSDRVGVKHWAHDSIDFVLSLGLMNGTGGGKFAPGDNMTRAMFVTVLSNIVDHYKFDLVSSIPIDSATSIDWGSAGYVPGTHTGTSQKKPFTDLKSGAWYESYVIWAAGLKLISGRGNGIFDPDGSITRAEVALLFYTLAGRCGIDTSAKANISSYADYKSVPSWAYDAVRWAVSAGLIEGSTKNGKRYLNPGSATTREQVAAIVTRFASLTSSLALEP